MPASVIPVTGLNLGPVGSISQSDFPLRTPRQVNPTDTMAIPFGTPCVLNANNTYSSVAQFLAGEFAVQSVGTTNSNTTVNVTGSTAGIVNGMLVTGSGIPAGTTITISGSTITLSAAATASATGVVLTFYTLGTLASTTPLGLAAANTRTNGTFPLAGTQGAATPAGSYAPGNIADVMTQGTMNVQVNNGTPTAGGTVYIRVAANLAIPAGVIGGIEAASDGGNTVAIDCMKFKTGILGADGTAQVTIPQRVMP